MSIIRGTAYAVYQNPVPIVVGNVSLKPSGKNEYYYLSSYIVDQEYSITRDAALTSEGIVFFDYYTDEWKFIILEINNGTYERFNSIVQLFPVIKNNRNLSLYMNPFVNSRSGFPSFQIYNRPIYEYQNIHFNEDANKWSYGVNSKNFEDNDDYLNHYNVILKDTNDGYYGNAYASYSSQSRVPNFVQDTCYISPDFNLYTLEDGNILQPSATLTFESKEDSQVFTIYPPLNTFSKWDNSPNVISGGPYLGFYGAKNTTPYIIGNICIGTEDHSVPPIIGTNKLSEIDYHGATQIRNQYGYSYQVNAIDKVYAWVGTSIDSSTKWNLYYIYKTVTNERGKTAGNYILLKGANNTDPILAEEYWYCSHADNLFSYNIIANGVTFSTGHQGGSSYNMKIVGITGLNTNDVKYPGQVFPINEKKYDIYIGNWLAPQVEWRTE